MQFRAELIYTPRDMRQYNQLHRLFRRKRLYVLVRVLFVFVIVVLFGTGTAMVLSRITNMVILQREHQTLAEMFWRYLGILLSFAFFFLLDKIRMRNAMKALIEQGRENIKYTVNDDGVAIKGRGYTSAYEFSSFCDLVLYKDTFYLYSNKNSAIIIPKRSFTEGDCEAFGPYLEQKTGLKIKELK